MLSKGILIRDKLLSIALCVSSPRIDDKYELMLAKLEMRCYLTNPKDILSSLHNYQEINKRFCLSEYLYLVVI